MLPQTAYSLVKNASYDNKLKLNNTKQNNSESQILAILTMYKYRSIFW